MYAFVHTQHLCIYPRLLFCCLRPTCSCLIFVYFCSIFKNLTLTQSSVTKSTSYIPNLLEVVLHRLVWNKVLSIKFIVFFF